MLDIPNERSSHSLPTPKGGGVAIVLSWYFGISILFALHLISRDLYYALMSGILLAVVSLIDDLINLKPYIRLIFQILSAAVALFFLKGFSPITFSEFGISSLVLFSPIAVIGIVWFVNLFNFLDGIDGYASLETSTVAMALYFLTGNIVCVVLIVCILGFLSWNWPKAKIFMGDVGSTQLGFILVVLGIYFHNTVEASIIHWVMLTSLFWFDATLTLFRRWRNGEKLTQAHKKHAYQRIVQSGFSHQKTIIMSFIINIIIIGLVFISKMYMSILIPVFIINMLFLYGITKVIDKKVPFK